MMKLNKKLTYNRCHNEFLSKKSTTKYCYGIECRTATKKEWYLKRRYNLTLNDFNQKVSIIPFCEGCFIEFDSKTKPFVDHNHRTGKIRGLLCNMCNTALGQVKDNKQVLNQLSAYLSFYE